MNFRNEDIKRQIRLGEDSYWEFKEIAFVGNVPKSPRRDDLADELAAFTNTDGGVLLCGVTDSGDVQGMSRKQMDALERLLTEICTDAIKPPVRPTILRKEIKEGKPFLLVEIPQGYALHNSPGGSYHRVGSTKRQMTTDEQLRLAQQRGQARFLWFDKQPVSGTGFGSLDESLWKSLLSAEGATAPELALEKMGLLTSDENGTLRATVAGVLLCTRSPEEWLPNACISSTCYRGTDRASGQIDAQTITGPLNQQIAEAVAFAVRNMRVGAYKNPARTDLPQYSERALFEAIVNAVVHRDYAISSSRIRLSMFADRIEINSPGGLPNNLTIDSMAVRQSTRNEALASILGRIPVESIRGSGERQFFMERRGDGVPTIFRETEALSGKAPEYQLIDNSDLVLTIPAADTDLTPATAGILVHYSSNPLSGVELLVLFPNKTWKRATTDENGHAQVDLHTTHLPMTVFAAAPGFAAHLENNWAPAKGELALEMQSLQDGGSVIFSNATGNIPGLSGHLNPIRDTQDRTSLYASNTAINAGQQQPVHFILGEDLHLTDTDGKELMVRVIAIMGKSALLEYRPYSKGAKGHA
ncbi:MAG: putative DNA binding domain-containing protein [Candidatus Poribacteria bacterium]|nr:putative DNA binding domain-containing protein [Candidatus Poribacteria bacterium]